MIAINKKISIVDVVFFLKLTKERTCDYLVSGWFELRKQQIVCDRIDRRVQSVSFIVQSNHGLVNRNLIRILSRFWL